VNLHSMTAPLRHAPYVLLAWGTKTAAALVMGYGAAAVASRTVGAWPAGDLLLFEPGGLMLSESARVSFDAFRAVGLQSLLIAVAMIPIGIVTSTLLMASLDEPRRVPLRELMSRAGAHLWPMTVGYVVMTLFAGGLWWACYMSAEALFPALQRDLDPKRADLAYAAIIGFGAVVALLVSIVHDLLRAAIVQRRTSAGEALAIAFGLAKDRPLSVLVAWWSRAAGIALLAVIGWRVAGRLGQADRGLTATLLMHQLIAIACVVLRASWLARAMELIEEHAGPRKETPPELQELMDR